MSVVREAEVRWTPEIGMSDQNGKVNGNVNDHRKPRQRKAG